MTEYGVVTPGDGDVTRVPAEDAPEVAPVEATPTDAQAVANSQSVEDDENAVGTSVPYGSPVNVDNGGEAAAAQRAADAEWRANNPDTPLVRASNPDVGGE